LQLSPYKVFLVFLYLWVVLNKNLKDDTLSSLSNLHNMQIKSAITKNPFSGYSSLTNCIRKVISAYTHVFWVYLSVETNSKMLELICMGRNMLISFRHYRKLHFIPNRFKRSLPKFGHHTVPIGSTCTKWLRHRGTNVRCW